MNIENKPLEIFFFLNAIRVVYKYKRDKKKYRLRLNKCKIKKREKQLKDLTIHEDKRINRIKLEIIGNVKVFPAGYSLYVLSLFKSNRIRCIAQINTKGIQSMFFFWRKEMGQCAYTNSDSDFILINY